MQTERIETLSSSRHFDNKEKSYSPLKETWDAIQMLGGPVIAHAHLDRADTITKDTWKYVNAPLQEKWSIVDDIKKTSTEDQIFDRMVGVVERVRVEGVKTIGSFIDVDAVVGRKAMRAADRLRKYYSGEINFVFANQTLKGVIDKDAYEWFLEGAEWADIVGGLPGKDHPYRELHTEIVLETAKSLNKMAHVHVDQLNDTSETETEMLALKTIESGMQGRIVAIHSISLASHEKIYRDYVYNLMKEANLMAVSCPTAWINARRKEDMQVSHNAVTPVDEFRKFGIIAAMGPDNIRDVYMPFTEGYMSTELVVLLEATHHYDPDDLALIATVNGKKVLGLYSD